MATPKTQGFSLSALPRSPSIPNNIGLIDVKAIDDGVRRGLATMEMIRRAPQAAVLADEAAATDIAQQQAQRAVLPTQTQATLADIPNKSAILAGQAQVAQAQVPAQIGAIDRQAQAQAQAAQQFADFTDAYANAQGLADYAMKAQELETLPVKFPWLTQVPEYKTLLSRIADSTAAARTAAQQQGAQGAAVELAKTRAVTRPLIGTPFLLARMDELRKALVENPGDEGLQAAIEDTQMALNNVSASTKKDPVADTKAKVDAAQAKTVVARQKLETQLRNQVDAASTTANDIGELIDTAISEVGPMTSGPGGRILSAIPGTPARNLERTLDTIKANIGFQTLNSLRQLSATGGALGNVSDREVQFLQSTLGSLDATQSPEQLRTNLAEVKRKLNESLARVKASYDRQFGGTAEATGAEIATPTSEFKIIEVK